jgi:hypothetical protein
MIRVHELAKELGLKSQELLDLVVGWGFDIGVSALASLETPTAQLIRERYARERVPLSAVPPSGSARLTAPEPSIPPAGTPAAQAGPSAQPLGRDDHKSPATTRPNTTRASTPAQADGPSRPGPLGATGPDLSSVVIPTGSDAMSRARGPQNPAHRGGPQQPSAGTQRQDAIDRSPRRNDELSTPDRLPQSPPSRRQPTTLTGAADGEHLPLGVMSLADLELYDDPVLQIPFLSSLLELVLTILFPGTRSEQRGLINEAYSSGRMLIRSVNKRELNHAMTIRNRIIHPISHYDEPAQSPRECETARDNLFSAVRDVIDRLPEGVERKIYS